MGSCGPKQGAPAPRFLLASLASLVAFFTAASAVIDPQDLAALTQVVQDLGVPIVTRWAAASDPCTTWTQHATCDAPQTRVTGLLLNSLGLSGVLSPALGNLTRLTSINLSNNLLQGSIPESIGLLTSLSYLSLGLNNLTGPIPESIGQMAALDSLFLDNNFLSGTIPASIGSLTTLTKLHLYCNHLEGEIPSQLGALSQVTEFQLHSNKLTGQIPAALANLTKVIGVRLNNNQLSGPLYLPLLQAWGSSIKVLHLHRNAFWGDIPAIDETRFPILKDLNLGFNQLTGQLPVSIGSMALLSSLFVGHNFLEGPVPGSFTNLQNLQFLDLSHNALNGSLLDLTGMGLLQTRQFDLTFNNFDAVDFPNVLVQENNTLFNCLDSVAPPPSAAVASSSHLGGISGDSTAVSQPLPSPPPGYSVLQCVRYLPGETMGFAVNAGGIQQVINTDQQVFSPDATLLDNITTGTEVKNSVGQWAVQMSGEQGGTFSAPVEVSKNTDSATLYQSMRWSSQYLAYIGRNMRNGIFHVKLHFAEIVFNYPGYRVFDVMVQGEMIKASLDVVAVAGPQAAYVIDLTDVSVEDGLLRIELIHVSPINRYIDQESYQVADTGPMLSAFSVQAVRLDLSPSSPLVPGGPGTIPQNSPGKGSAKSTLLIVLSVIGSLMVAVSCTLIAYFCFFKGRKASEPQPVTAAASAHKTMRTAGRNSSGTQVSAGTGKVQDFNISIPEEGRPVETSHKPLTLTSEVLASLREALAQQQEQLDHLRQQNALQAAQIVSLERTVFRSRSRSLSRSLAVDPEIQGSTTPDDLSDIGPTFYTYDELFVASNGFSEANELGRGGFGSVYKGVFPDGSLVAIKQLTVETQQSREAFRKEIAIISSVQHRNLLTVKGCCLETELPLLVCEYMPNGSLDKLLRGRDSQSLDWPSRRNIAVGAACGLAYLHDESKYRIIHCDVKPANILLDKDFNARIADFGLARLYDDSNTHITTTTLQGTRGYLAPEYALHLQLSEKADVYSFGIVLLELVSGRRIVDQDLPSDKVVLVEWAQQLGQEGSSALRQLVDPRLSLQFPEEKEVLNMATIANWCTQPAPSLRPKMRTVWLMLNGTIDIPELPNTRQSKRVAGKPILSDSSVLPIPDFDLGSGTALPQASSNTTASSSSTTHTTASSSSSGAGSQFVEHQETQLANLLSRDSLAHSPRLSLDHAHPTSYTSLQAHQNK